MVFAAKTATSAVIELERIANNQRQTETESNHHHHPKRQIGVLDVQVSLSHPPHLDLVGQTADTDSRAAERVCAAQRWRRGRGCTDAERDRLARCSPHDLVEWETSS